MLYETGRRPRASVLLVLRPRLLPISACQPAGQLWCYKLLITVHYWKRWFFGAFLCNFSRNELLFLWESKAFFIFIFYCMRQELDLWTDWPSLTRDISVWNSSYRSLQGLMTWKEKNSVPQTWCLKAKTVASNMLTNFNAINWLLSCITGRADFFIAWN